MFSGSQIGEIFNQLYLKNKLVKQCDFLDVDTNSHKLKLVRKFFGGNDQEWI